MFKLLISILTLLFCMTLHAQNSDNKISKRVLRIVNKLRKENTLHLGMKIGYGGKPETSNKYYKLYQKLKVKATNNELVTLTNDKSKLIVLYSFLILQSRNYLGMKQVFLNHINDSTYFWIKGVGCIGIIDTVNSFMLEQLNPSNAQKGYAYLTKEEYDEYLELFKHLKITKS